MDNKTRALILAAALRLAHRTGLYTMTRDGVAAECGVGQGTVTFHFNDMHGLRTAVIKEVIAHPGTQKNRKILAEALGRRDYFAMRAPAEVKREALGIAL